MQTIEHLTVHVVQLFGKVDKQWMPLCLYTDKKFPNLCPVQVLLMFLYLIDWKGGYIFQSDNELHDLLTLDTQYFQTKFQWIFKNVGPEN